ncbi:ankyrin repeat and EF-hand domain-containing protein 1 isoform X2 [Denticeps clupeoides]|uniref:ankyrin repeat and EF-hand domain-containing protein 1 isoform X2 n=1 Tax=Denticeps clupeoides TaxID=299321 RepID=UPI0010A4C958|nr:ankyrin repeat and EF-hand domain-containing protein 1-like isoform X2 [Denticeps clupeoides]
MTSPIAKTCLEVQQIYKLIQCVHKGDKIQIDKLVIVGLDNLINLTEPHEGKGVLHLVASVNNTDMASYLLSKGAHPDVQDKRGCTSLMLAAELGYDNMVTLLTNNHANMNLQDMDGKGVLFYCLYPTKRHMRCLQVALDNNADVNNMSLSSQPVFLQACQAEGCLVMCLSMLDHGANPNATNQKTGRSALMEAARAGAVELVRAILRKGANVNALDKKKFNAVHFAAEGGYFEVIQILSAYSADMGLVTAEGNTALHYAARGGHTDCCRFLAQRGCNPKLKNEEGLLPRQIAKDNGHKFTIKELKKAERLHGNLGSSLTSKTWALNFYDWSQEYEAILRSAFEAVGDSIIGMEVVSREKFVSVMQEHRAPLDTDSLHELVAAHDRRREGWINIDDFFTGLMYLQKAFLLSSYSSKKKKKAAKGGKDIKKTRKFTLPVPVCTIPPELIHRRDDGGPPHFMIEAYQSHTDPKRFDRDHPPVNPIEDDSSWYIDKPEKVYINISHSVRTCDLESLKVAFSQKVPVDIKDCFYKTPLMTACSNGNYEVVEFLLGLGADVNATDQFRWTPLHHACHAGQLDIIELLIKAGANVDSPALNGATPLMRAIESCRPCCVDYLIKAGANVTAKNKKEENCLDIALTYTDTRTVELIQAKLDSVPKAKDNKNSRTAKVQHRPRLTLSAKEKQSLSFSSPISSKPTQSLKKKKESVILHNTQITNGTINKVEISFTPRMVWGNQMTTKQLIEQKRRRRERFTNKVDFENFLMPFNKNIYTRSLELFKVEL